MVLLNAKKMVAIIITAVAGPSLYALDEAINTPDCFRSDISGAVCAANKTLSVLLNREKNTNGVKRQWRGLGEGYQ